MAGDAPANPLLLMRGSGITEADMAVIADLCEVDSLGE
jgi:hypothetical protein